MPRRFQPDGMGLFFRARCTLAPSRGDLPARACRVVSDGRSPAFIPAERSDRRSAAVCALVLFAASAVAVAWHLTLPVLPFDDAFITYRYARNVAAGEGPVYNLGERVMGYSSPAFLAWLVLLEATSVAPLPEAAVRGNVVFLLATALVVFACLIRAGSGQAVAVSAAALLLLHPEMVGTSMGGMESFLFAGLLAGALWAAVAGRDTLVATLVGLLPLVRPEGLVFTVAAGGFALMAWKLQRGGRRTMVLRVGLLTAPLLAWCLAAQLYYGSFVPLPILAKLRPLYPIQAGETRALMLSLLREWTVPLSPPTALAAVVSLVVLALAVAGCVVPLRDRPRTILIPAALLLLAGAYAAGNPVLFPWYHPALYALWLLTLAAGLPRLVGLSSRVRRALVSAPAVLPAVTVALLALALLGAHLAVPGALVPGFPRDAIRLRVLAYAQAGELLNRYGSGRSLAAPEIGALGYSFSGRVFDACALVTPEALPFIPGPPEERQSPVLGTIGLAFIAAVEPDFVVTLECLAGRSLLEEPWFRERYRLVAEVPLAGPIWFDSDRVFVFARGDVPQ